VSRVSKGPVCHESQKGQCVTSLKRASVSRVSKGFWQFQKKLSLMVSIWKKTTVVSYIFFCYFASCEPQNFKLTFYVRKCRKFRGKIGIKVSKDIDRKNILSY
jgi:hypothetical protein